MSSHYDLSLVFDLKQETPQQVLETISYMLGIKDDPLDEPPDHPYFQGDTWHTALQTEPDSPYFPGAFSSSLRTVYRPATRGQYEHQYTLSVRLDLLDDELWGECFSLVTWLAQQSETEGYVGYWREADELQPTLLYFKGGFVYSQTIGGRPKPFGSGVPDW